MDLVDEHAERDEHNQIVRVENGVKLRDTDAFTREVNELLLEEIVIDETEERRAMLLSVRDSLLNATEHFSEKKAVIYDRLCTMFEELQYTD